MALIGITLDRTNPAFSKADFAFWMPQFAKYINYYTGKILVGSASQIASVYSNNLYELTIGQRTIELISADEETYTGSMVVQTGSGQDITTITYTITLVKSTMLLTLVSNTSVTTSCTLKSEGNDTFNQLYELANKKVFESIYGSDWKFAMSLCIAHYLTLIANQVEAPSGNTLQGIAGGATHGVLSSMSVGSFSKSYDLSKTMVDENEAMFWNLTSYGAELMALLKTKAVPSILVVTSNPITGAN